MLRIGSKVNRRPAAVALATKNKTEKRQPKTLTKSITERFNNFKEDSWYRFSQRFSWLKTTRTSDLFYRLIDALAVITKTGWLIIALLFANLWFTAVFHWVETATITVMLTVLLLMGALFMIGRQRLDIDLDISPTRVQAGEAAAARVMIKNNAHASLLPLDLEFPVGISEAQFRIPKLAPYESHDEVLVIPTSRRGVISVGPVITYRGDPLGMLRREVMWAQPQEVFVHPKTVALQPFGTGLLRDLEGRTTSDIATNSLNFHTLREYVPGDDRRYIHWRSSAKLTGALGQEEFLVQQFLDTRRPNIGIILDVDQNQYRSEREFELAISAAASLALQALVDETNLIIVAGEYSAVQPARRLALDTFSRVEYSDLSLAESTANMLKLVSDTTVVIFVSGSAANLELFRQARKYLSPEIVTLAISVSVAEDAGLVLQEADGLKVATITKLRDLPTVLERSRR